MPIWNKLKAGYQRLKAGRPGDRFLQLHEYWNQQGGGVATTVGLVAAGVVSMAAGLFLGLIPGVPGIVLGLFGAALIAMPFRRAAIWLDRAELGARRTWQRCRRILAPHRQTRS